MVVLWTFGIALLGIVLIFLNKLYELRSRRETFMTRLLSRYDRTLEKGMLKLYFAFKKFEDWLKNHASITFPNKIRQWEQRLIDGVSNMSARFVYFWRGKKELLPRAKVSKFIASILEYRYHSERERKRLIGTREINKKFS